MDQRSLPFFAQFFLWLASFKVSARTFQLKTTRTTLWVNKVFLVPFGVWENRLLKFVIEFEIVSGSFEEGLRKHSS